MDSNMDGYVNPEDQVDKGHLLEIAQICDLDTVTESFELYTPDAYNYQAINVSNSHDFTLTIRARNDIHIGLFTDSSDMYEVVIGGWGN